MMLLGALMALSGLAGMAREGVYPAALLAAALGATVILTGTGILAGRGWARIVGLLLAGAIGSITLAGLPGRDDAGSVAASALVVGAGALVLLALASSGDWFRGRPPQA